MAKREVYKYDDVQVEVKEKKGITLGRIFACILGLGIIAGGVVCAGFASRNDEGEYFKNPDLSSWHWANNSDSNTGDKNTGDENLFASQDETGGVEITESERSGIQLFSAKLPRVAYAANGISEQADGAYLLTAEVLPADVEDKTVDWSVEWKNPESTWAQGKTVTDYLTITPTSDGALTANAECFQAFGEQITITVTPRRGLEGVKGTGTADYVAKILGFDINGTAKTESGKELYSFQIDPFDLNPVIDYPSTIADGEIWHYYFDEYAEFNHRPVLSDHTKGLPDSIIYTMTAKVCATSAYLGTTENAEVYKSNSENLYGFFLRNWGYYSNSEQRRAYLRNHTNEVMLRMKFEWANNSLIYNFKFSAESLAPVVTDVTVPDIEF